jgi:hypothetical protein
MNKFIALALLIIFSSLSTGRADISADKRKEIEKLLRLTGVEKLADQMKNQMLSSFRTNMPQVPELFWTKFEQKMDTHELVEKIIPVYDKYYTTEDLKALNAFYESAVGQKVISTLPQVMQETMKIGQDWGQKIGKEAAEQAEAELKKK